MERAAAELFGFSSLFVLVPNAVLCNSFENNDWRQA